MSNGYTTVDGEIILSLPPDDFFEILKEVDGCEDLLLPHIRLSDNKVIFRDQDLKLLIPEEFFKAEIPAYKPSKMTNNIFIGALVVLLLLCVFLFFNKNLEVAFGAFIWFGAFIGITRSAVTSEGEVIHLKKHRQALYTKAKLTSFLHMTLMQDVVAQSTRLERSNTRLERDMDSIKALVRDAYRLVSVTNRSLHLPENFPDGEEIASKSPPKYN